MVTTLSGNGDLSRRSCAPQNDAAVIEGKVQHAQAVLGCIQILRPSKRMSPNTPQHGSPVIGTQKVPLVDFHAIIGAAVASRIAARPARARELHLQARPDSLDVRSDADALLRRVHEAVEPV